MFSKIWFIFSYIITIIFVITQHNNIIEAIFLCSSSIISAILLTGD